MNTAAIWTVENATACIAIYGAKAAELESMAAELVHAPFWLDCYTRTAEANRREESYCRSQLERLLPP